MVVEPNWCLELGYPQDRIRRKGGCVVIICKACLVPKDSREFSKDSRKRNGCQSYCKPCAASKIARARAANPEKDKATRKRWEATHPQRHLKHSVGITLSEKRSQFKKQGSKCGACGSLEHNHPYLQGENGWCADHDHETRQFRGVICWPCNMTLGFAHDSVERVLGLLDYLAARNTLCAGAGYAHEEACYA